MRLLWEQQIRRGVMLKITVDQEPGKITLKLEGSLSGAWVSELEDAWRAAAFDGTGRAICVDLAGVVGIDAAGRYLLLLIHERGGQMIGTGGRILDDLVEVVEGWRLRMDS
jgi:ABC-type transporter Mla MlaB component